MTRLPREGNMPIMKKDTAMLPFVASHVNMYGMTDKNELQEIFARPSLDDVVRVKRGKRMTVHNMHKFPAKDVRNRQKKVLEVIRRGYTDRTASGHARVTYGVIRKWLENDAEFAEKYTYAEAEATDLLEEYAFQRAFESDRILETMLKAKRPEKFGKEERNSGNIQVVIRSIGDVQVNEVAGSTVREPVFVENTKLIESEADED